MVISFGECFVLTDANQCYLLCYDFLYPVRNCCGKFFCINIQCVCDFACTIFFDFQLLSRSHFPIVGIIPNCLVVILSCCSGYSFYECKFVLVCFVLYHLVFYAIYIPVASCNGSITHECINWRSKRTGSSEFDIISVKCNGDTSCCG